MVGTQLLHYKITRKLGAGGMGEVFEAEDLKLGRTVALKFVLEQIAQDEQAIGRFEREAKAVSRLDHPNVGAVFALEQDAGKTFLAMARYQGETLRERLDQARLSLHDAMRLSLEIARGLEHAHAQGVTHRDVKPANIFLSRQVNGSGLNNPVVKLLDFGLARLEDASRMMTKPGATTGTLMYMAPEQMRGQMVAHQVDVWAWGAVTFEMLAGRPPFVQDNIGALLAAILSLEPDPLEEFCPEAPAKLIELVKHALRKNPAERVESASLIVRELEAMIAGGSAQPLSTRVETPNLQPGFLENTPSASDHPVFVSGSSWSNSNWPQSETVTRVEPTVKPAGSKSALWLLVPVVLVGIAGGFGIINSRLSQPIAQPTVIPESSSKPVIASSPAAIGSAVVALKPASKPAQAKPNPVKPVVPAETVAVPVPAEVKTPARTAPVSSATPSTVVPAKPSPRVQPRAAVNAPQQTSTVAPAPNIPVLKLPVSKPPASKPAVSKASTTIESETVSSKPTAPTAPVIGATPEPPRVPECKPLVQANAVLERVLIASGNTLPLIDCGSYLHAKGPGNPGWFPEALEVRREVIALPNGTVMIADAVHYADARKPLGLIPMPADAKKVENADLGGGHQWRSESENITLNAMNLVYMETQVKGEQLEVTSSDDPGTDFVFLTVYQGGTEPISNLNVSTNDAYERNFAGLLLNDETAVFLGPGAQANATNFDVTVPPGIKTYLVAGLEPGTSCKIGFEPDRNWWYISIKLGSDGTVNSEGVVVLETKAPTN